MTKLSLRGIVSNNLSGRGILLLDISLHRFQINISSKPIDIVFVQSNQVSERLQSLNYTSLMKLSLEEINFYAITIPPSTLKTCPVM